MVRIVLISFLCFIASNAFARDYWGSIVVDLQTGKTGAGIDYLDEKSAKSAAMSSCRKKGGKNCVFVLPSYYNSCGAAAWAPTKKEARGAWNDNDLNKAKKDALLRCLQLDKDPNCKIVEAFCTHWETEEVIWW